MKIIGENFRSHQRIYIGVINVVNEEIAETVRDRVLMAAKYIPLSQLGMIDNCGFYPFYDDVTLGRATAFAKVTARVQGAQLASY